MAPLAIADLSFACVRMRFFFFLFVPERERPRMGESPGSPPWQIPDSLLPLWMRSRDLSQRQGEVEYVASEVEKDGGTTTSRHRFRVLRELECIKADIKVYMYVLRIVFTYFLSFWHHLTMKHVLQPWQGHAST